MGVYADLHNSNTSAVIVGQMTSPVSSGLFLYTDNTLTVMNLSGTEQNQKVNHFGKITGNLSVNNHNIYTEYGNYIVNDYNYWLFANYVKNYDVIANGPVITEYSLAYIILYFQDLIIIAKKSYQTALLK